MFVNFLAVEFLLNGRIKVHRKKREIMKLHVVIVHAVTAQRCIKRRDARAELLLCHAYGRH